MKLFRIIALLFLIPACAQASQTFSALPTTTPPGLSGTVLATTVNSNEDALLSTNAGTSAPGYSVAGSLWTDTTNQELKFNDGTQQEAMGFYNPSTGNFSAPVIIIANAGTTGTTLNKLAKLSGSPSTALIAATTDTRVISGLVMAGAGATGSAHILTGGYGSCVFDGATAAGDYVQISQSTAGDCHDTGSNTYPTGGQVIGRSVTANSSGGTYAIFIFPPEMQSAFINPGGNTKVINISQPPYNASGYLALTTTSGSNSSGVTTINVNSTTGFNAGQVATFYQGGSAQTTGHKNFSCLLASVSAGASLTCSTTAISGNLLPASMPSSSGTSLTTTIPAGYNVVSVGTTTLSASASNGATSITLTNASGYGPKQGLFIYGGAASGANLITQITSVNGNTVGINPAISNSSGAASGTAVKHDETAAFQLAVNQVNQNQSVKVTGPDGYYQINGPTSGTDNAIVNFPSINYYVGCCSTQAGTAWWPQATLHMTGFTPAPQTQAYLAGVNMASMAGMMVQSDLSSNGGTVFGAYNSGSLADMTNIQLVIDNITFRAYPNPQSTMIDATYVAQFSMTGTSFDTGETSETTQPTSNNNNSAFKGPAGANGGNNAFERMQVYGWYYGAQVSEHTALNHIRFDNNYNAMLFTTGTGPVASNYGITALDVECNADVNCVSTYAFVPIPVHMTGLNIEHQSTPAWAAPGYDINDGQNELFGIIEIDNDNNGILINGAQNVHVVDMEDPAFPNQSVSFANLGTRPNQTFLICKDCVIATPCAGSGNGALALRVAGAWVCK